MQHIWLKNGRSGFTIVRRGYNVERHTSYLYMDCVSSALKKD
jgi:hypothetical protein